MFDEIQEARSALTQLEAVLVTIQGGVDPTTTATLTTVAEGLAETLVEKLQAAELVAGAVTP